MNNVDILIGVMHLKEASDLLRNSAPELSFKLLELSQFLLNDAKLSASNIEDANNIVEEISSESSIEQ